MKHVWILNHYAVAPGGAGGTRHYSLAKNLPAYGWSASIIASSVELNTGRQRLQEGERSRLEIMAGVPFLWIRTPEYKGNGGGRMVNMLAYAFRVLLPSATRKLERPDVIVGSSVHPFAALSGAFLARRHKVPFVFEVRDLWPQTLIDLGRIKEHGVMATVMRWMERWLYRRADRIVVLLPRAVDYIAPMGIAPTKVVWVPNGVELSGYPDPGTPAARPGEPFTMMYFGAHGQANGLDNVLHAMKLLRSKEVPGDQAIRLRVIGDGPQKPSLLQLARELQLTNVAFEPPVPKSAIPALAAEADAFVFNLVNAPVFRYGISSNKLFDFMAGARPIVFCCDASNNPVREAGAGPTVPPGDPEALADAILAMAKSPLASRTEHGAAGRRYVEQNHGFQALAGRLAHALDDCLAEKEAKGS